jgi:hypothetical protein
MKETNVSEPPMKHRNSNDDIQTRVLNLSWDKGVEGDLLTVHAMSGVKEA